MKFRDALNFSTGIVFVIISVGFFFVLIFTKLITLSSTTHWRILWYLTSMCFIHLWYMWSLARWITLCVTPCSPNTYLIAYSYFMIVFFWFTSCICFVLWIIYMIVLPWIWIRELGVSPTLNRGTDPRVLLDLDFLVFWFDRFQFQTSFSNILDFSWFSGIFLN